MYVPFSKAISKDLLLDFKPAQFATLISKVYIVLYSIVMLKGGDSVLIIFDVACDNGLGVMEIM